MYRADLKALKTPGLVQDFDKQIQGVFKDYIQGSGGTFVDVRIRGSAII